MWARIVEVSLGCFLAISSFIFPYPAPLWIFDFFVAVWIWFFALASYHHPLRKIHLMNLIPAFTLIVIAWMQPNPPPAPAFQNYMVIALLLFLFTILPSHASSPPDPWSKFYQNKNHDKS